ncbi:MAG TPA: hypothetical protein VIX20_02090 [Ktedonobacteraceae bacterium]
MSLSTSLDTFRLQAKRCRRQLKDTWASVSDMCNLFSQEEDIWPNQCNHVRNSLLKLGNPLQSFYELLDTDRLPAEAIPFRYSLIIPLHHIDNLMDELILLITAFRAVCRTSSRDAMIRRREIQRKLGELEQGIEDILQNVDRMLIQVLTQEKSTQPLTFNIESAPQPIA